MAELPIKENPEFQSTMRKLETTDRAHANLFNEVNQTLLDNDNYLKGEIADLEHPEFDDSGEADGISDFNSFIDTLKSKISFFDFFRNLKAGLKYVIHTGKIANDGLTTEEGFVADARQMNPGIPDTLAARLAALTNDYEISKKSSSDGKTLVAAAITQMGISTAADAAFATMANNIRMVGRMPVSYDVYSKSQSFITGWRPKYVIIHGWGTRRGGTNGEYTYITTPPEMIASGTATALAIGCSTKTSDTGEFYRTTISFTVIFNPDGITFTCLTDFSAGYAFSIFVG